MRGTTNVPCVYTIIRNDSGQVAFVLRENTGYMDGLHSLPAGHLEGLENFREAAVREAREEANVTVDPARLQHVHTMHRNHGDHVRVDVFFEAQDWSGEPRNSEPERHAALVWFSLDDLPFNKIMPFQAQALRHIIKKETYSETGW